MVSISGFHPEDRSSILRAAIMVYLTIVFKTWTIDPDTFKGKPNSFTLPFGPFDSIDQAKWMWLSIKEKMNRSYDIAIIHDKDGYEMYADESSDAQPY